MQNELQLLKKFENMDDLDTKMLILSQKYPLQAYKQKENKCKHLFLPYFANLYNIY